MCLLWSRRINTFKLYLCSYKHVFKRFTLFERDDRRSFKDCFQQRLILYKAPSFHQYLFNIFNSRVVCGEKRQNPLVTFFLLCKCRLSRGKVDLCQRTFYDVLGVPACLEALFEFHKALFKRFFFF